MKHFFKTFAAFALVFGLATPALAGPGGRGHGPKLHKLVEKLNLDEATAAKVKAKFEASREAGKALHAQVRAERDALHTLLEADNPDRAAIMAQVEKIGALKVSLEKQRMGTMLEVRELLTPEQRLQLKAMHQGRMGKRGKMGKRGWKRKGPPGDDDEGPEDDDGDE